MKEQILLAQDVCIFIDQDAINPTLTFLLSQNIPFFLQSLPSKKLNDAFQTNEIATTPNSVPLLRSAKNTPISQMYQKYFEGDFANPLPEMNDLAKELKMSVQTLKKRFKEIYSKPFYQLYLEKKMEHAATLLKQGHNAQRVTEMVGYGKTSAIKFNKMFQKHFGTTPKKYQMEHYGSLNKRK